MAQTCPCGCGRRVGWTKKGPAKLYPQITDLVVACTPAMNWVITNDVAAPGWQHEQTEARKLKVNCEQVRHWLLDHIHGQADPRTTPNLMQLNEVARLLPQDLAKLVDLSETHGGPGIT